MADLEDEHLAPVNGLSDNAVNYDDDSTIGHDASHLSKFGDTHSPSYDPFSSQPYSDMSNKEYDPLAKEYDQYGLEPDFTGSNQARDYGHYADNPDEEDLPANFAKEAAGRHQNVSESEQYDDQQCYEDEVGDEDVKYGGDSNPFPAEAVNIGSSGSYVDNNDRPIVGYNPFLNEEQRGVDQSGGGQEEDGQYCERGLEEAGEVEQEAGSAYNNQFLNDEVENVDNAQQGYDDEGDDNRAGHGEEDPVDYDATEDETGSYPQGHEREDMDSRHHDNEYSSFSGQGHIDGYQYPGIQQQQRDDLENVGVYEDDPQEGVENISPQTSHDLGIVNQGFSDDVDVEGEKIIPEEEMESETAPVTKSAQIVDTCLYGADDRGGEENYREERDDKKERYGFDEEMDVEKNTIRRDEEEIEYLGTEKEDYAKETDRNSLGEEENVYDQDRYEEEETESVKKTKEGEPLRMSEEMERSTLLEGGHFQDEIRDYNSYSPDERGFTSDFGDSGLLSKDRSFVDNLSEVTSPETIPQPLPSPPEPRSLPQAAVDSASYRADEENVGQHSSLFQDTPGLDRNTTSYLTAGEVEGETKFDVDGTAITSTSQNNAFLHSDEESEDEEEEEEEEGEGSQQHLDQGGLTGTTETTEEASVDEKSSEYVQQMTTNDNALMSMSMEGSFYDDGGELIGGGDDRRSKEDNILYEGVSVADDISEQEQFPPKQENFLDDHGLGFAQEAGNNFVDDQETYRGHDGFDNRGDEEFDNRGGDNEFESTNVESDHHQYGVVNGGGYEEDVKAGGFDSLIDFQSSEPVLQPQVLEHSSEAAESAVDIAGLDFTANESESSVDSQQPHPVEPPSPQNVGDILIPEIAAAKPEEPASSVDDESPAADKEQPSGAALGAAAATAAGVTVAAAAAAAATAKTTTTTTVKKSTSAKAGAKTPTTTTTTTTTKVTKETKVTNGKPATTTTKKTETTTTSSAKPLPRKPTTDSRPTSAATSEKKVPTKTATSPTKPPSAAPKGPVPSYAQPVAARKPKEPRPATASSTTEDKKKPLATSTLRTSSSATHKSPRPQSAAATSTITSTTSTTTSMAKTTSRTTTTTAATRTALLSRPKSSPSKLTNGTASSPSDTKTLTKKTGVDSTHKPGSGTTKVTIEKREVKTKVETVTKSPPQGATPTKSPTKTPTPRPSSTSKTGEVKSKIGSMDNATHTPGGGNVKIASKKPDFTNVTSKIGSKDKMDHKPGGGNIKIENKKVKVEAKSKIGSLNNATHKPGGGDKKVGQDLLFSRLKS